MLKGVLTPTLQPVCDWLRLKKTEIAERSQRLWKGFLKVANQLPIKISPSCLLNMHKALLTPTLQPVRDLFATDFFATDCRSMRLAQPLYAHIRIEDFNCRLVGNRFATGLRLIGDLSP